MNYFNYFTEIEETFIRRRGKHLLLSPLDWALIESWQEREIPLRIVLRGIENVFDAIDKKQNRTVNIKSLTYCRDEIEAQYDIWLKTQVGKSIGQAAAQKENAGGQKINAETSGKEKTAGKQKSVATNELPKQNESTLFSPETIQIHLENTFQLIEKSKAKADGALRQVLDKVAKRISEHQRIKTEAETLEESLNELEGLIDQVLLVISDEQTLERLNKEIEKELAGHRSTMEKDVYRRTFDLMLLKKLREQAEIPQLSLFYL